MTSKVKWGDTSSKMWFRLETRLNGQATTSDGNSLDTTDWRLRDGVKNPTDKNPTR